MDKRFCEFYKFCKVDKCPYAFKKQCRNYVGWYIISVLNSLPGKIDFTEVLEIDLESKVYYGKNSSTLKTILFFFLVRCGIKPVKYLTYNRAIQAALAEEPIEQKVVFINMAPSYKEIDKGVQTIESLAENLLDQKKIVILLVKSNYTNSAYTKLC